VISFHKKFLCKNTIKILKIYINFSELKKDDKMNKIIQSFTLSRIFYISTKNVSQQDLLIDVRLSFFFFFFKILMDYK